jgi:hypothetical protein
MRRKTISVEVEDTVRMVRIMEYIGPRKWVMETLSKRIVKGTYFVSPGRYISEAIIGDLPEIIQGGTAASTNPTIP